MTEKISLSIAGLEHMTKQPRGLRYALFCKEGYGDRYDSSCETKNRGGYIGDYEMYIQAKQNGILHPHPVIIRFYTDYENRRPSDDFLKDWRSLTEDDRLI